MSLFACLACEKDFKIITEKEYAAADRDDRPVVIQCGHMFHRTCLDSAFVIQHVEQAVDKKLTRRFCPYKHCDKDVTDFPVLQLKPVEVQADKQNEFQQLKRQVEKLQARNDELEILHKNNERCNEDKIKEGSKAYWRTKETTTYIPVTVMELQAKIKLDQTNLQSNRMSLSIGESFRSKIMQLPFAFTQQEQIVPISQLLSEKVYLNLESLDISTTEIIPSKESTGTGETIQATPNKSLIQTSNNNGNNASTKASFTQSPYPHPLGFGIGNKQPRWIAGDRIYIHTEKQSAVIKWIGIIQYKVFAVIEYDEPVGDHSVDDMDVPVRYKLGHGRKLDFADLDKIAVKENDPNKGFFARFMFGGSGRKKNVRPSTDPYEDRVTMQLRKPHRSYSVPNSYN